MALLHWEGGVGDGPERQLTLCWQPAARAVCEPTAGSQTASLECINGCSAVHNELHVLLLEWVCAEVGCKGLADSIWVWLEPSPTS